MAMETEATMMTMVAAATSASMKMTAVVATVAAAVQR
jgi:hypothetical protein